jgi:hypothetical protein
MVKRRKIEGGKFNLGNALKNIGHKIDSGAKKFFSPQTGKQIASTLIHQGIPVVASTLGSIGAEALAPELGPVSGFAGAQLGNMAGKQIATLVGNKTGLGLIRDLHHHIVSSARARGRNIAEMGNNITEHNVIYPILHLAHSGLAGTKIGRGFFDKLKKVAGVAWKTISPFAKTAGKHAVSMGADALGEAVSSYTGNPAFGEVSKHLAKSLGDVAVDNITEPKNLPKKEQIRKAKKVANDAIHLAQDEIGEPRKKASLKSVGLGIHPHRRHRGHHHLEGGAIAPMESQITYVGGNNDFNTPAQLGSPFQYTLSPAMNPFFNNVNQLQGYNPIEKQVIGGSFSPAGVYGGSMMVHHIHHHNNMAISRPRGRPKKGGSFLNAGNYQ